MKILIIEDTRSIREELKDILTFEGMNVVTAEDGEKGIEIAKKETPDLILCDIMMPKKDGYQVYKEIMHSELHETPFIFLTAKATSDNVREGMILGADDYITKPFNIDLLVSSIKRQLEKKKSQKKIVKNRFETLQTNISQAIPHELLTPLNAIIGLSKICAEKKSFDVKTTREFANAISDSGKRLYETIRKFIYYTEIELLVNNPIKNESYLDMTVDMGSYVIMDQGNVISKKHNRESDLKLDIVPFKLKMNYSHFEIVILNILDNAFKFSKAGDNVEVQVVKGNPFVEISICDNGIGMSPDNKEKIDAFTQFDRPILEQQGLGLGLITSYKLIEFYGGKLNWEKNKNKGTTFTISLLNAE